MKASVLSGAAALALGALTLGSGAPAAAQTSTNRVAAETAWSVFVEANPRECWVVSAPSETVNTQGGRPAPNVRRGDILLFTTFRPGNPQGEVSFTGGFPFAPNSTVGLTVGNTQFQLFVDGQWAWSGSAEDDARIIAAMRGGASAVLTARSGRGTDTRDTFSLFGYTAATQEAQRRCAN